jgi:hypothetical protein
MGGRIFPHPLKNSDPQPTRNAASVLLHRQSIPCSDFPDTLFFLCLTLA